MKKILALVLALAMALALVACGDKGGEQQEGGTPNTTGEEKVVKIGVFEPLTGDNGAGGKQEVLGMQYANYVQPTVDINGETYKVQLEVVDNRTAAENGPSAAAELVNKGVSIVLGSYGSGVSMAGGTVFAEAGVPAGHFRLRCVLPHLLPRSLPGHGPRELCLQGAGRRHRLPARYARQRLRSGLDLLLHAGL